MSACDIVHTQCNTTQTRSGHACPALLRAVPHKAGERPPRAALCSHSKIRQRHPRVSKNSRSLPHRAVQVVSGPRYGTRITLYYIILYYIILFPCINSCGNCRLRSSSRHAQLRPWSGAPPHQANAAHAAAQRAGPRCRCGARRARKGALSGARSC